MSSTGYKYIYKHAKGGKPYEIRIWVGDHNKCCGCYATLEEAVKAREKALKELGMELIISK